MDDQYVPYLWPTLLVVCTIPYICPAQFNSQVKCKPRNIMIKTGFVHTVSSTHMCWKMWCLLSTGCGGSRVRRQRAAFGLLSLSFR